MATESPHHPQPDEIPDDESTGDEPNPYGKQASRRKSLRRRPSAKTPLAEAKGSVLRLFVNGSLQRLCHDAAKRPIALHERRHEGFDLFRGDMRRQWRNIRISLDLEDHRPIRR
jgi:hypothetical protein